MHRRQLLASIAALGALPLSSGAQDALPAKPAFRAPPSLVPVRAQPERLVDIAVCTRPFRPQGPRIEAQRMHGKTVVHHYGHGGSGWSLSWGSALHALALVHATRERRIAVIGCGAIGLTTARVAQRAGLRVRIYCKDRPPETRSTFASGVWTPDSRIVASEHATPAFGDTWERMARHSFKTWQSMLGLPGEPVSWNDGYMLSDSPFGQPLPHSGPDIEPDYPDLEERIRDLRPRSSPLRPDEHPFKAPHARRFTQMVFHIATYQKMLLDDFFREGGEIVHREFTHPRQLASLPERTIVNSTGYGARALFNDNTIVPVRGQTARLPPQRDVDYMLYLRDSGVSMVPRHDGLLVQMQMPDDFGSESTQAVRAQSEEAVRHLAKVFA